MSVTIKDIAKVSGVSYATVSRALNNHPEINENTRKRILKIAKSMGYSPNAIARGLVKCKTNMLGLLIPDISNPYFPEVAKGVEDAASEAGYQVFLCNTDWDEHKEAIYKEALLEKRVDGLIVAPVSDNASYNFKNEEIPLVFIGGCSEISNASYVIIDNVKGSYDATEYLIKLGHRNIAFIRGKEDNLTNKERLLGFTKAMEQHGIKVDEEFVKRSGSFSMEGGYCAASELLKGDKIPTAILVFNDVLALGAIQAIEDNSYMVPEDISVIGFDDIVFASLPKINLTTVSQPKYETGKLAAKIMLKMLENKDKADIEQIVLNPSPVIRKTCGKCKRSEEI